MLKRTWATIVSVALLSGVMGATLTAWMMKPSAADAQPSTYTAREFRVVDASGRIRARLVSLDTQTGLALYDSAGNVRAHFTQSDSNGDFTGLSLSDSTGRVRLSADIFSDRPAINVYDENRNAQWWAP